MEKYFKKVKRAPASSAKVLPTRPHYGLRAAASAQQPDPGHEVLSQPTATPPRLSLDIIDCDADLAPEDVHEANVRHAMRAIVKMPVFTLPLLRTIREDSRAMLQSIPAPSVPDETHELLRHIRDVDVQGELIWCLMVRNDIRTFAISKQILQRKGFDTVQQLALLGGPAQPCRKAGRSRLIPANSKAPLVRAGLSNDYARNLSWQIFASAMR